MSRIPKTIVIMDEATGIDDRAFAVAESWAKRIYTTRICAGCRKAICKERVEALPHTETCAKCSTEAKKDADIAIAAPEEMRNAFS